MFKTSEIKTAYQQLIGWKQHFDPTDFSIDTDLTVTESGEYYQNLHPALRLDIIQTLIPAKYPLNTYLADVVAGATTEIFNDLLQYRQINNYGKTLLEESTLLNRYGTLTDKITNQSRFVFFQIRPNTVSGLQVVINEIGLQFAGQEVFEMYLFHSNQSEPLKTISVTTTGNGAWRWKKEDLELSAFKSQEYHGGVFILGYYQDDIATNAINYSSFNWDKGECSGCNNTYFNSWKSIKKHFHIYPGYVPEGDFVKGEMFDMNKIMYMNDKSWGLNLKMSVSCDLTDFFVQNKFAFKNLLGLKVVYKMLNDMKFSTEINSVEENIKMMIIRDLEGDIDTKLSNLPTRYQRELKAVTFNISGINGQCLGCESESYTPKIGVV